VDIKDKKHGLEFLTEKSKIKIKTKENYELKEINQKEYTIKLT